MEPVASYRSVYPRVPCTIRLPNTRLRFLLAKLAEAARQALGGLPAEQGSRCRCLRCDVPLALAPTRCSALAGGHGVELPAREFSGRSGVK